MKWILNPISIASRLLLLCYDQDVREETLVVSTDCLFQSVYGYLITTQDVDQYFMVSPVLHFDGDSIRITSRINNELYYWAAGI